MRKSQTSLWHNLTLGVPQVYCEVPDVKTALNCVMSLIKNLIFHCKSLRHSRGSPFYIPQDISLFSSIKHDNHTKYKNYIAKPFIYNVFCIITQHCVKGNPTLKWNIPKCMNMFKNIVTFIRQLSVMELLTVISEESSLLKCPLLRRGESLSNFFLFSFILYFLLLLSFSLFSARILVHSVQSSLPSVPTSKPLRVIHLTPLPEIL